ncbi:unnamed protein product [Rotaria sp. Silwood1]|nr:unnamed protein product [Rotaria sp. Silwood1]
MAEEDYQKNILKALNVDLKPSSARLLDWSCQSDKELYPGAHIATGEDGPGNHYHHGIVLDNTGRMEIVHFWGENKNTAKIQTTTLPAFVAGSPSLVGIKTRPLYLIRYDDDNEQKRQETVSRAKKALKEADKYKYDLLSNNCECLAFYCRAGDWTSEQADKVQEAINRLIKTITEMAKASVNASSGVFKK